MGISRLIITLWAAWAAIGCAPTAEVHLLMHLRPDQEDIYRNRILKPFEKKHNCIVSLRTYRDPAELPALLASGDAVDLADTPLEQTRALVARGLMAPLEDFLAPGELGDLRKEHFLMDLGGVEGRAYFLPRHVETPVLIYLKSRVAEAVQYWEARAGEINGALAKYNGAGLPRDYALEADPSLWDNFDLFVAGYYWSTREIGGDKRGRIALGPIASPAAAKSLMDKCFQAGATPEAVLAMDGEAVTDMFHWQSAIAGEGILNPGLIRDGWGDGDIRDGFRSGEIFLSEATQMEAFLIHGNGTPGMPGFLENPEDMGVAQMPRGSSLMLDSRGQPLRIGSRRVATRSHWWGVPRKARDPALSFRLARHLTDTRNQVVESSAFGTIPVRQDLLGELGLMFGGGWTSEVFHIASRQIVENRFTVHPLVEEFTGVGRNYTDAYRALCLPGQDRKTRYADMRQALEERYVPRQRRLLGAKYPMRAVSGAPTGSRYPPAEGPAQLN